LVSAELLQEDLDAVKEHWNTHRIRKSRNDTTPGVPDVLYYLPEGRGGRPDLLHSVPDDKISYVENHLIEKQEANEHFEYFQYVINSLSLKSLLTGEKACNYTTNLCQYQYQVLDQLSKIVITPMIAKLFIVIFV